MLILQVAIWMQTFHYRINNTTSILYIFSVVFVRLYSSNQRRFYWRRRMILSPRLLHLSLRWLCFRSFDLDGFPSSPSTMLIDQLPTHYSVLVPLSMMINCLFGLISVYSIIIRCISHLRESTCSRFPYNWLTVTSKLSAPVPSINSAYSIQILVFSWCYTPRMICRQSSCSPCVLPSL